MTNTTTWKICPEDPTGEMFRAVYKVDNEAYAGGSQYGADDGQRWWAMYDAAEAPEGLVIAPHYRGYAELGKGQYLINHSDSSQPAELVISVATEQEKAGRIVGDERENLPGALLQPDAMAVRIHFDSVAGLDALENQLRKLRAEHFSAEVAL